MSTKSKKKVKPRKELVSEPSDRALSKSDYRHDACSSGPQTFLSCAGASRLSDLSDLFRARVRRGMHLTHLRPVLQ